MAAICQIKSYPTTVWSEIQAKTGGQLAPCLLRLGCQDREKYPAKARTTLGQIQYLPHIDLIGIRKAIGHRNRLGRGSVTTGY